MFTRLHQRTSILRLAFVAVSVGCSTTSLIDPTDSARLEEPLGSSVAAADQVRMFIGQEVDSIAAYAAEVAAPPGAVGYTALTTLSGIDVRVDSGAGPHHLDGLAAAHPHQPLALGLYLVGALGQVNQGSLDENIRILGEQLGKHDVPVLLRIGYEFDGAWTAYEPAAYRDAFRRIAEGVRATGASNVEFVWQSMAGCEPTFQNQPRTSWYPGDDVVDWVSVSLFVEPDRCDFRPQREMVGLARRYLKPFYIAEATPMGFDLDALTISRNGRERANVDAEDVLSRWFDPYFAFIEEHDDVIRATTYINADWDSQPMWGEPYNNGYWGDSRVQADPAVLAYWQTEMAQPVWVQP